MDENIKRVLDRLNTKQTSDQTVATSIDRVNATLEAIHNEMFETRKTLEKIAKDFEFAYPELGAIRRALKPIIIMVPVSDKLRPEDFQKSAEELRRAFSDIRDKVMQEGISDDGPKKSERSRTSRSQSLL